MTQRRTSRTRHHLPPLGPVRIEQMQGATATRAAFLRMSPSDALAQVTSDAVNQVHRSVRPLAGDYDGIVVSSYSANSTRRPPGMPGHLGPWIVAYIPLLHWMFKYPGDFDPTKSEEEAYYYAKARQDLEQVGVFIPQVDDPNYFKPAAGAKCKLRYTNNHDFGTGGTYTAHSSGNPTTPTELPRTHHSLDMGTGRRYPIEIPNSADPTQTIAARQPDVPFVTDGLVYPLEPNDNGYEIEGLNWFVSGDINSMRVVYYFAGQGFQVTDDSDEPGRRAFLRNVLAATPRDALSIGLKIDRHGSSGEYSRDAHLRRFFELFRNAPTPEAKNNVFFNIERGVRNRMASDLGVPLRLVDPAQATISHMFRSILLYSNAYDVFNRMDENGFFAARGIRQYEREDIPFNSVATTITGIGALDSLYSGNHYKAMEVLAQAYQDGTSSIKVAAVHNRSISSSAHRDRFDQRMTDAGAAVTRTNTTHGYIPMEYVEEVTRAIYQ